jgi:hypothetical protein
MSRRRARERVMSGAWLIRSGRRKPDPVSRGYMACSVSTMRFDPRAWNLLTGLSLVAGGCSGRTIGSDDADSSSGDTGESDNSEGSSSESESNSSESGEPECENDTDCPPGYYCLAGVCEYQIAPDGSHWYECYELDDCDPLELCAYNYCQPILELGGCEPTAESGIPLAIGQAPLALAFVDLDADGAEELVAASETELHVFENGANMATVSARVQGSPSVTAMVAGDFEPGPGQDLALLVDDTILIHPSDGMAGFAAPSESPSPQLDSARLLAGDFDGEAPNDLLVWGPNGASVIAGEVWTLHDNSQPIGAAAVHDLSSGNGRFVLRAPNSLLFYSLDGMFIDSRYVLTGITALVTPIIEPEHLDFSATVSGNAWTLLELFDLDQPRGQWGVTGEVSAMASGDLDGEGRDEVALLLGGGVALIDNVGSEAECITVFNLNGLTGATQLAIGDWDGDGDGELVVAFAGGEALVFNGEG